MNDERQILRSNYQGVPLLKMICLFSILLTASIGFARPVEKSAIVAIEAGNKAVKGKSGSSIKVSAPFEIGVQDSATYSGGISEKTQKDYDQLLLDPSPTSDSGASSQSSQTKMNAVDLSSTSAKPAQ